MNITHDAPRPPKGPDAAALGLYVARTSCTECHGMKLEGSQDTPALSVVAAYSAEQFAKLMREGVPKDGRKLGLMAETAKHRFAYFTDEEVNGLYTYLSQSAPAVAGQ